ncbi:MAG: hypothetical protein ACYDAG_01890 [Chloroflexota bacterium]
MAESTAVQEPSSEESSEPSPIEWLTVADVEAILGRTAKSWLKECQFIVPALHRAYPCPEHHFDDPALAGMTEETGGWQGPINPRYDAELTGVHVWLQLTDGRILDPLRWEFQGVEPYIYVGHSRDEYLAYPHRTRAEELGLPEEFTRVFNGEGY